MLGCKIQATCAGGSDTGLIPNPLEDRLLFRSGLFV